MPDLVFPQRTPSAMEALRNPRGVNPVATNQGPPSSVETPVVPPAPAMPAPPPAPPPAPVVPAAPPEPSLAQRVYRGVEAAVTPQVSAARAGARNARAADIVQSEETTKPPAVASVAARTSPRSGGRAAPRGGPRQSTADDLNAISLQMAQAANAGRTGPMPGAPGSAELNIARKYGYAKGGAVPSKYGRQSVKWGFGDKPKAR